MEEDYVDLSACRVGCGFQWIADHPNASKEDECQHLTVNQRILYATPLHFGALEDQADVGGNPIFRSYMKCHVLPINLGGRSTRTG